MALSSEQKQIRSKEAQIGKKAAEMATQYFHKNIRDTLDIKNEGGIFNGKKVEPILESSRVKPKMGEHKLLGLDATSNRYAFIHHYGFLGERTSSFVRYSHSRFEAEFTNRKSHFLAIEQRPIFEKIYYASGAMEYLQKQLTETRTEDFQVKFNAFIVKLSEDHE